MDEYKFKTEKRKGIKTDEIGDEKKSTLERYKDFLKKSQENFKIILEQRNVAYTKINQLNSEIKKLKERIIKQRESITNLEKKPEIEINKIREEYKDRVEELETLVKEKDEEIEKRKKNFNDLLEKHKTLLCSRELLDDPNLKEEKSYFLEKLWKQTIKRGIKREPPKESEEPKVLNLEDYKKSEKCVCGKSKKFSSKGCPNCRKEAEKYNKRDNVGMEKSWEKVWSSYGVSMEYP
ncbi:hypothetical protein ES703_31402 [subsurface metagenome]